MLRLYLKIHRKGIGVFALFAAVTAVIFALYRLPLAAVGYTAAVCFFFGIFFLGADFGQFCHRRRELMRCLDSLGFLQDDETELCRQKDPGAVLEHLPDSVYPMEQEYQELLHLLCVERSNLIEEMEEQYRELIDYYTVWVHQIKTPIAAMRLMLQEEPRTELSEELQRIEQYVEMVLCYLRLHSDSTDYVIKEYDLDEILKQAIRRHAQTFIRKKLRLDYEPLNARVVTDEKWLLFVIDQILSNALKYTSSGSISIVLEEPKTLCICDTGIGIASEDLPRIFEKGYTGYNGREDKKASGIGMYLCRRICDNLGHHISVESAPGLGTKVRLDLKNAELEVE